MNILLNNIDPMVVKKLEELAKKKKMSRNKFIIKALENVSEANHLIEERNELHCTLNDFVCAIEQQQKQIEMLLRMIARK